VAQHLTAVEFRYASVAVINLLTRFSKNIIPFLYPAFPFILQAFRSGQATAFAAAFDCGTNLAKLPCINRAAR
jgi:hypothetical protein